METQKEDVMSFEYDIIVVGAGHAGCEAASAAARMGSKTLLITMDMNKIAQMSCNPAVGGIAKGQIVREIDALGGQMGIITDRTAIQFRMLNQGKGPAMWSPRSQTAISLIESAILPRRAWSFWMYARWHICGALLKQVMTSAQLIRI